MEVMTDILHVIDVVCVHGDVKTTIRTDRPAIPAGLLAVHDDEQPRCAPHSVQVRGPAES